MATAKIILNMDVPGLGSSGDVVTVARGYARNYLVPRKMAHPWTKGAQKQIDEMIRARRRREISNVEDARAVRDAIEAHNTVVVSKRAGHSGRLFGAVSTQDVVAAVEEQIGQTIDRRKVIIEKPIKAVGKYQIQINLHEDISAKLFVNVEGGK